MNSYVAAKHANDIVALKRGEAIRPVYRRRDVVKLGEA
jgi:hypothetical protein